jgi:hypothetical protein
VKQVVRYFKKHIADKTVRILFIRGICLCIDVNDVDDLIKIIAVLLFLCIQKKESALLNECKDFLVQFIQGRQPSYPINVEIIPSEGWFEECEKKIWEIKDVGVQYTSPNVFHNIKIAEYIKYLSRNLMLWTAIIPNATQSEKIEASSAIVESFFSHLKTNILNGEIVSLDTFLDRFVTYLESEIAFRPG